MRWIAVLGIVVAPLVAVAGPSKQDVMWSLTNRGDTPDTAVRFGFDSKGVHPAARTWQDANGDRRELIELRDTTIATAVDGTAAWVATRARRGSQCAGLNGTIDKCKDDEEPSTYALVLYDRDGKKWNPIAVHSAIPIKANGVMLDKIPSSVDATAEPAVTVFKSSFADPKALAASVSKRKDVVLFGTEPTEKIVGGAKVATTLAKWKLTFTVRDGIAAGTSASKTVAWVAANVDARSTAKPNAPATPYRVLCLYEKTKDWQLVAVSFSFVAP